MSDFKTDGILTGKVKFNTVTTVERDLLTPVASMTVFNSDTNRIEIYSDGSWESLTIDSDVPQQNVQPTSFTAPGGADVYPLALGGITSDASGRALVDGQIFQDVLENLLFPVQEPTSSNPAVSLSLDKSLEIVGATVNVTMAINFSQGSINSSWNPYLDDNGQAAPTNYVGALNNVSWKINNSQIYSNTLTSQPHVGHVVGVGQTDNRFQVVVSYDAGPEHFDSRGNEIAPSAAAAAGSVTSTNKYILGTYPIYTNENIETALDTQLPLIAIGSSTFDFDITWTETVNKHAFSIADTFGSISIAAYNALSGNYDTLNANDWSSTPEVRSINGQNVNYTIWHHTGANAGARQYRITLS